MTTQIIAKYELHKPHHEVNTITLMVQDEKNKTITTNEDGTKTIDHATFDKAMDAFYIHIGLLATIGYTVKQYAEVQK